MSGDKTNKNITHTINNLPIISETAFKRIINFFCKKAPWMLTIYILKQLHTFWIANTFIDFFIKEYIFLILNLKKN